MTFAAAFRDAARQRWALYKTHCRRARVFRDAGKTDLYLSEREQARRHYNQVRYYISEARMYERKANG